MFEFMISRASNKSFCPCDDAYEINGIWYVSFDGMEDLLDFIKKEGNILLKEKELIIMDNE